MTEIVVEPADDDSRRLWSSVGDLVALLPEIYNAEDRDHAEQAAKAFATAYGAKWPIGGAAIPLIVSCQCAVARRVAAP